VFWFFFWVCFGFGFFLCSASDIQTKFCDLASKNGEPCGSSPDQTKCYSSTVTNVPIPCDTNCYNLIGDTCLAKSLVQCKEGTYDSTLKTCKLDPKCILSTTSDQSFADQNNSIKKEDRTTGPAVYKCSPLSCDTHQCQTADCESGYDGHLQNSYENVPFNVCQDQSCDAFKPYYEYCGKKGNCDLTNNLIFMQSGVCYEKYCTDGAINASTGLCEKTACPTGSTENTAGDCIKN
jgi:hypothetical protein